MLSLEFTYCLFIGTDKETGKCMVSDLESSDRRLGFRIFQFQVWVQGVGFRGSLAHCC